MERRQFLQMLGAGVAVMALAPLMDARARGGSNMSLPEFETWQLSEVEWRERLSTEAFRVLREHGTERAGSSPLDKVYDKGTYYCAGCGLAVFASDHKYDSATGGPSFFRPISDEVIGTSTDWKLIYPRTEVHCARCGGHFGHVFKDGPKPTGLRYCLNGVALRFEAA